MAKRETVKQTLAKLSSGALTVDQALSGTPAPVPCAHCAAQVGYLEVFPAQVNGTGSACLPCFIKHVDAKRTDQQRFETLMGAFGGGRGEVIIESRLITGRPVKRGAR